jgi:hypothetical protein
MRAHAVVRGPDGEVRTLGPGDIIGRSWCAALHIDDPRVSEAHALVSLRGDRLQLLALRGRFAVDGKVHSELVLAEGQRVLLTPELAVEVLDVVLPSAVLGVRGAALATTALHGATSIVARPDPALAHANDPGALLWLWPGERGWKLRDLTGQVRAVEAGDSFEVAGHRLELVSMPLVASTPTQDRSVLRAPLRLVARYETVHIFRRDTPPVVLEGVQARLVSELVSFGVPVAWSVLAAQLWSGDDDPVLARKRLDGALARLRSRLRETGVRVDLVRPNGLGQFELFLYPDDVVEDQL